MPSPQVRHQHHLEQTPWTVTTCKQAIAFDEVLSQYGLKQAYRYSVSRRRGPIGSCNLT